MSKDWLIQCAWCGRLKDAKGDPIDGPVRRPADSHGICNRCAASMMTEIAAMNRSGVVAEATA